MGNSKLILGLWDSILSICESSIKESIFGPLGVGLWAPVGRFWASGGRFFVSESRFELLVVEFGTPGVEVGHLGVDSGSLGVDFRLGGRI